MFIKLVMLSSHLILCRPLLLLPLIFPSIRIFSNESALCIRWPKYWSFSFSISSSSEYSGLISFRSDCFNLLAVQGSLKCLLQHHTTNTENNAQCSAPAPQVRTWYLTAKLHLGPKAARTAAWFSPPKAQRRIYEGEPKEDIQMATEAMQRSSCYREMQINLQ